jgi:hypothetical protein
MAKSEWQRQKKSAAKKRKNRKREAKKSRHEKLLKHLSACRQIAPQIKQYLIQHGHGQKFYDFLDSYEDAFEQEVGRAKQECPTLLGIHELDDADYYGQEPHGVAAKLGYSGLTPIFFMTGDDEKQYLDHYKKADISGNTIAFKDEGGNLRTLILIRKSAGGRSNLRNKYALKIVALLHEIGHVKDREEGINFKVDNNKISIVDAEVFAHEYALHALLEGDYRESLKSYLAAFEKLRTSVGLDKIIALRLLESELFQRCKEHVKTNWLNYINPEELSQMCYAET